jgi:hypothetical protein
MSEPLSIQQTITQISAAMQQQQTQIGELAQQISAVMQQQQAARAVEKLTLL